MASNYERIQASRQRFREQAQIDEDSYNKFRQAYVQQVDGDALAAGAKESADRMRQALRESTGPAKPQQVKRAFAAYNSQIQRLRAYTQAGGSLPGDTRLAQLEREFAQQRAEFTAYLREQQSQKGQPGGALGRQTVDAAQTAGDNRFALRQGQKAAEAFLDTSRLTPQQQKAMAGGYASYDTSGDVDRTLAAALTGSGTLKPGVLEQAWKNRQRAAYQEAAQAAQGSGEVHEKQYAQAQETLDRLDDAITALEKMQPTDDARVLSSQQGVMRSYAEQLGITDYADRDDLLQQLRAQRGRQTRRRDRQAAAAAERAERYRTALALEYQLDNPDESLDANYLKRQRDEAARAYAEKKTFRTREAYEQAEAAYQEQKYRDDQEKTVLEIRQDGGLSKQYQTALESARGLTAAEQALQYVKSDLERDGAVNRDTLGQVREIAGAAGLTLPAGKTDNELRAYLEKLTARYRSDKNFALANLQHAGYDADKLDEYISRALNAQRMDEYTGRAADFAADSPVGASAASSAANLVSGMGYLAALPRTVANAWRIHTGNPDAYVPLDENSDAFRATRYAETIRQEVARQLQDKTDGQTASFLYDTGMSMLDNILQVGVGMGLLGAPAMAEAAASGGVSAAVAAGSAAASPVSLGMMGLTTASQKLLEMTDEGVDTTTAYNLATAAGAIEVLTEKIGLDEFINGLGRQTAATTLRRIGQQVGRQTLAEGTEEAASDVLNLAADLLLRMDQADFIRDIDQARRQGLTQGEAVWAVVEDQLKQTGVSFAGGALSGALFGLGGAAMNAVSSTDRAMGRQIQRTGGTEQLQKDAAAYGLNADNLTRASSPKELGAMQRQIYRAAEQTAGEIEAFAKQKGYKKAAADALQAAWQGYKETGLNALSPQEFGVAFDTAYQEGRLDAQYGQTGAYLERAATDALTAGLLPETVKYAYLAGTKDGGRAAKRTQSPVHALRERAAERRARRADASEAAAAGAAQPGGGLTVMQLDDYTAKLRTAEGKTVTADQLETDAPERQIILQAQDDGYGPQEANALLAHYDGSMAPEAYYEQFREAITAGQDGESLPEARRRAGSGLTAEATKAAWELGQEIQTFLDTDERVGPAGKQALDAMAYGDAGIFEAYYKAGLAGESFAQARERIGQMTAALEAKLRAAVKAGLRDAQGGYQYGQNPGNGQERRGAVDPGQRGERVAEVTADERGEAAGAEERPAGETAGKVQATAGEVTREEGTAPGGAAQRQSARALGIPEGTDRPTARVITTAEQTEAQRKLTQECAADGLELIIIEGTLELQGELQTGKARGARIRNRIIATVSSKGATLEQIVAHERRHKYFEDHPEALAEEWKNYVAHLPAEALDEWMAGYAGRYAYLGDAVDEAYIIEEMLCDMAAGIQGYEATEAGYKALEQVRARGRFADTQKNSTPESGTRFSGNFWRPDLNKTEWGLLKSRLKNVEEDGTHRLDEKTAWVYIEQRGTNVFAIYSTENSEDPTVLYAVSKHKAKTLYEEMAKWKGTGYDNNGVGKNLDEAFKSVRVAGWDTSTDLPSNGDGRTKNGNVQVPARERKPDRGGNPGRGTQNKGGLKEKFSLEAPVEETRDLLALHNKDEDSILAALKLGGLPMPSIAVVKGAEGHSKYGPISLIFDKNTIDPQEDRRNKVYGGDAYTPTKPSVEYKIDTNAALAVEKNIYDLSKQVANGIFSDSSTLRKRGIEAVSSKSVNEAAAALARDDAVRAAYMAAHGLNLEPVLQEKVWDKYGNETLQTVLDEIGVTRIAEINADFALGKSVQEALGKDAERIENILRDYYRGKGEALLQKIARKSGWSEEEISQKRQARIETSMKNNVSNFTLENLVRHAWDYYQDGGTTEGEIDRWATSDKLIEETNGKDVQDWIRAQLDDVFGEPGIYNGKDPYTASGIRKNFAETHYSYTLENIVRAMQETQEERGGQVAGATAGGLQASSAPVYGSIAEIKADSGRLGSVETEAYKEKVRAVESEIREVINQIRKTNKAHSDNSFEEGEIIGAVLMDAAKGSQTAASIMRSFAAEGYKVSSTTAQEIQRLYQDAAALPTEYFEAKPQRAVGFDEVLAAVVPDNSSEALRSGLQSAGVRTLEYKAGDDADRLRKVNSVENARFSEDSDEADTAADRERELEEMAQELEDERKRSKALESVNRRLREQMKVTPPGTADPASLRRAAKQLSEEYGGALRQKDIAVDLQKIWRLRSEQKRGPMLEQVDKLAAELVQHYLDKDNPEAETLREIKQTVRATKIYLTPELRGDLDLEGGYQDFRRRNFGRIRLANSGLGVDQFYQELSEQWPAYFPAGIWNPADQLLQIADVIQDGTTVLQRSPMEAFPDGMTYMRNKVLWELGLVQPAKPTAADKVIRQAADAANRDALIDAAAAHEQEQIDKLTAWHQKQLQKVKADREDRIQKVKDRYQERAQAERDWKAEQELKRRLLWHGNKLKRMGRTATPEQQAEIERIFGDINLACQRMTGEVVIKDYIQGMSTEEIRPEGYRDKADPRRTMSVEEGFWHPEVRGDKVVDVERLKAWYEEQKRTNPDFIADRRVEDILANWEKKQINTMTPQEVQQLLDVALNIENEIRTQKKLIDTADRREIYQQVLQIVGDIEGTRGRYDRGKLSRPAQWITENTLTPVRLLRRWTGFHDSDPLYQAALALQDGELKQLDYQRRAYEKFEEFTKDKKFMDHLAGKGKQKPIEVTGINEKGETVHVKITPDMRVALYLHSRNYQNLRHIQRGGITVPQYEAYVKGNYTEAYDRGTRLRLMPRDVRAITDKMTTREKNYAERVAQYYDTMSKAEINGVSVKLKGYEIAKVQRYYPIETDKAFIAKEFDALRYDGSVEGKGFLKERQEGGNPILLRDATRTLQKSIRDHALYVGMAIPIRNFNKLRGVSISKSDETGALRYQENSLMKALEEKWGTQAVKHLEQMVTDLSGAQPPQASGAEMLNRIRSNYAGAVLELNPSTGMKQLIAYPSAASVLGWDAMAVGLTKWQRVNVKLINRYTPLLWHRMQGFIDADLGDYAKNHGHTPRFLNWNQAGDLAVVKQIWKAAEWKVAHDDQTLLHDVEKWHKATAELFNRVVLESQANYTTMERGEILRTNNVFLRSIAMFKTEPFQAFNVLYDAFANTAAKRRQLAALQQQGEQATAEELATAENAYRDAKKRIAQAVPAVIASNLLEASIVFAWALFRGKDKDWRDEETDEITAASFFKQLALTAAGNISGIIPYGSEITELLQAAIGGDRYYGVDILEASALTDMAETLLDIKNTVAKMFEKKETDEERLAAWGDTAKELVDETLQVLQTLGLPAANIHKSVDAIARWALRLALGKDAGEYTYRYYTQESTATGRAAEDAETLLQLALDGENEKLERVYEMATRIRKADDVGKAVAGRIRARVKAGTLDAETAVGILQRFQTDTAADDLYWDVRGWQYMAETGAESFGKYNILKDAIFSGGDATAALQELEEHGVSREDAEGEMRATIGQWYQGKSEDGRTVDRDQAVKLLQEYGGNSKHDAEEAVTKWDCYVETGIDYSDLKQQYVAGTLSDSEAKQYLQDYGAKRDREADKQIKQWDCKKDTGIDFDDIKAEYLAGSIDKNKAAELRQKYGGSSEEDAQTLVLQWDCKKDTDIDYEDIKWALIDGDITEAKAAELWKKYGGKDDGEAANKAAAWKLLGQHQELIDQYDSVESLAIKYIQHGNGAPIADFFDYYRKVKSFEADRDAEGKTISGSRKEKVVAYIADLPLTAAQKDGLMLADNAKYKLDDMPW